MWEVGGLQLWQGEPARRVGGAAREALRPGSLVHALPGARRAGKDPVRGAALTVPSQITSPLWAFLWAAGRCLLPGYVVEGSACNVSRREQAVGGLGSCGQDKMCPVGPCKHSQDPRREQFTSSLWLQEQLKAEELIEQRNVKQDQTDKEECQRTDDGSRSCSDPPPVANTGARSSSWRHKPGSERTQHPKKLRTRDEF